MPARIADPAQSLPWRSWYGLLAWKARSRHQLRSHPLCASCLKRGRVAAATVADHIQPHKGDWNAFRLGPLQSLCRDCHQGKWADDRHGYRCDIGDDGLPIDPRHPFNRGCGELAQHEPTDAEVAEIARGLVRAAKPFARPLKT